jgi:adhesin transport system outer membrane protein
MIISMVWNAKGDMQMKTLRFFSLSFVVATMVLGASLKDEVKRSVETSPIVKERLKNYNATRQDIRLSAAGYHPKIDVSASAGKKYTNRIIHDGPEDVVDFYDMLVTLRQNLFNGWSTHEQVNYQKMRTLAAAYSYIEKANDVALQTIKSYISIMKEYELLKNAQADIEQKRIIYDKVLKAYKAGLTTLSEVSKIQASLSLSKANLLTQKRKLEVAQINYRKVTGKHVAPQELETPPVIDIPQSLERATMFALEYNPSVVVGKYNIKGAEALYREAKSKFYPQLDFELGAGYSKTTNGVVESVDDYYQALIILSYNLYNGGADEARRLGRLSRLHQEVEVLQELRRQVVQSLELSWNALMLARERLPVLEEYEKQSLRTLKLFTKEYEMGARSLLDLLAAQNDLKRSIDESIIAKYDLITARYRVADGMGLTLAAALGNIEDIYSKVGLVRVSKVKDRLPVNSDIDKDTVAGQKDICPVSDSKGVYPFGCKRPTSDYIQVVPRGQK